MVTTSTARTPSLVELSVSALRTGMFVARLDRPWLETPFAIQGFFIEHAHDIELLNAHCSTVFVDPSRSRTRIPVGIRAATRAPDNRPRVELKVEFTRAKTEFRSAQTVISDVFQRIKAGGELNVERVAQALNPVIDSVLRNHDAMAILARVKEESDYTFGHCLSCAVWAAVLGRHLALDRVLLEQLVLGTALIDVGKVHLPSELLERPAPLSDSEMALIRGHVERGVDMLRRAGNVAPEVIEVVACHHERWDGSGYPEGRAGSRIPLLARIAGLVDAYDAMITPRPWLPTRSSFQAIQELQDLADSQFQRHLVEQFTAAIGLFPTGSIVELNTGEVGIVTRQNPVRRLRPELVLVLGPDKSRRERYELLDLMQESASADAPTTHWIVRDLPRGAHGINAEDFYL